MTAGGASHLPAASLLASSRQRGAREDFMRLPRYTLSRPKVLPTVGRQISLSHPTSHQSTFRREITSPFSSLRVTALVIDAYLI